jgi:eukaryotic-like serine/threonine-protein kinase
VDGRTRLAARGNDVGSTQMTPERWQTIQEIFAGALARDPAERASYLTAVCTDTSLRREVELMIDAHEQGDSRFLEPATAHSQETLKNGTSIGPYSLLGLIGAGGMGEVYRARDSNLGREVAIKVLPAALAHNAERLARFEREAKFLASLNHPNIALLYGLEDSANPRALVMELVEGATLAERIKAGPIPIDETLPIARQICEALEYAHERGVVHRDLKPANIKISREDSVKVLDFGLAKAVQGESSTASAGDSPMFSEIATRAGVLLGTATYMSPEQAKGKPIDRRADIWAFGCVLYEMLTRKKAFPGDTIVETLAAVLHHQPDWSQLPSSTPIPVRVLLQRCLQKDSRQRLRDIGDARISLDEVLSGAAESARSGTLPQASGQASEQPWRRVVPWAAGILAVAAAAGLAGWNLKSSPAHPPPGVVRFQIPLPEKASMTAGIFALSPDGRQLAFPSLDVDGVARIWVRSLDSLDARSLEGTEGVASVPFWSPDSRFIAFAGGGKLKKIAASGGPSEAICDWPYLMTGGSWNRDGVIIFGGINGGLMRVQAAGGEAVPLTLAVADEPGNANHHSGPAFLSDGRHFIYFRWGPVDTAGVYLGSLDAKPNEQSTVRLLASLSKPVYVASSDLRAGMGNILFVRDGVLLAQAFDERRLALAGEPIAVADNLGVGFEHASFSATSGGVLVYQARSASGSQLEWLDRQGKLLGSIGDPANSFYQLEISPDGKRAVINRGFALNQPVALWVLDFARGTTERFTLGSSSAGYPVWSPDGRRIAFQSVNDGSYGIYQQSASGASEKKLLLKLDNRAYPTSWSHDGRFLLCTVVDPKTREDLWVLPLGGDKRPFPLLRTVYKEEDGRFSPDGHWVAYASDESGGSEIYVRPFTPNAGLPGGERKWLISNRGGILPRWSADGRELFYLAPDGTLMLVEVHTSPDFHADVPKPLFRRPAHIPNPDSPGWDVTADGKRFLFSALTPSQQAPLTVVLNWQVLLKK